MAAGAETKRPRTERGRWPAGPRGARFTAALVLAVVLHGIGLLLLQRIGWHPQAPDAQPLQIELVAPVPRATLPPLPRADPRPPLPFTPALPQEDIVPAPLPPSTPRAQTTAAAAVAARTPVRTAPVRASQAPVLLSPRVAVYDRDGRLRVPDSVLEGPAPPVASWVDAPGTPAPWDQRIDPLVYTPTALEPLWKPDGESLLNEFLRRNTKTKTFKLPDGTRVTCGWVLLVGGCSW